VSVDVIVIGGGPAGLMAAGTAATQGAHARLWEKNHSPGRKLLATGNGRCNLGNDDLSPTRFHGADPAFTRTVLGAFDGRQTREFFRRLGVDIYADDRGRWFPRCNEASAVLAALQHFSADAGAELLTRHEAVGIVKTQHGFTVRQRGETHRAAAVVIACGGRAHAQLGSDGGGFAMARQLGHRIIEPRPSLVPLELEGNWYQALQGIRWDMALTPASDGEGAATTVDEGLFAQYGLSGPLALRSSRRLGAAGKKAALNFMPGQTQDQTLSLLRDRRTILGARRIAGFLTGVLPEKIGRMLVVQTGIDPALPCTALTDAELQRLAANIAAWPVTVRGPRPFKEAQATAGGVDSGQIDPRTMMSTLAPGLFFCGEVADVDGDSGGYNLQWAWSSGHVAGSAAAEYVNKLP
jgi:hypothetical protein